jgi:signal transduction histidine kinase
MGIGECLDHVSGSTINKYQILLRIPINGSLRDWNMGEQPDSGSYPSKNVWLVTIETIKPYALALLIFIGLLFELVIHYQLKITIVYTHFYYLVIAIAGLLYGKKAVYVAIFFGALQIFIGWIITGSLTMDTLIRAAMLFIVAFIIGSIVDTLNNYYHMVEVQNQNLREVNERLAASESAFQTANRKLNLLSSVTRHDIRNQLTALLTYLELSHMQVSDPLEIAHIEKEQALAHAIERQIEFMKTYEDIGVHTPQWQDIRTIGERLRLRLPVTGVALEVNVEGIEIYADPLLEKVFENLADNSLRHGERVRQITITSREGENGEMNILYEDDGVGIRDEVKEKIFIKGFGKNTGLGMFLSREILAITNLTIREIGTFGSGVRFEIHIPEDKHRTAVKGS